MTVPPAAATVIDRLAEQDGVFLLRHPRNQGKGGAVISGLREARRLGFSHALQVDADGQHDLSGVELFLDRASQAPDAVICGYPRYDASVPKGRLYARYLTHVWVWINTLSLAIRDSMCGFRVYPLEPTLALLDRVRWAGAWISTPRSRCACTGSSSRWSGYRRGCITRPMASRTSASGWTTR